MVHFDGKGHRSAGPVSDGNRRRGQEKVRVAVMGDSFVEAIQVPYEQTAVGLMNLNSNDDSKFMNFGCSSYSPVLHYLKWNKDVRHYMPTHVILLLYSNDVRDDKEYAAAAIRDAKGVITAVPGPPDSKLVRLARKSYLLRYLRKSYLAVMWRINHRERSFPALDNLPLEENPDISATTAEYLLRLRSEIEKTGATLTLAAVPSKFRLLGQMPNETRTFADILEDWAVERNINWVDLKRPFADFNKKAGLPFFKKDIHFNEDGQRLFFESIRGVHPDWFKRSTVAGQNTSKSAKSELQNASSS